MSDTARRFITVVVNGGIVHSVHSTEKSEPQTVVVLDYDTEGLGIHETHDIVQSHGVTVEASLSAWTTCPLTVSISDYIREWLDRSVPLYVIYSDDEQAFWSNEDGWTKRPSATRFTADVRHALNLPIAGRWVELT